ncbi:DNA helicase IV [Nonlabens ulvanivorans]|uniref:DNA helicase IV n=1 Tax=Nonlabens ulvanivorans TaxID=906888 RepID=A0A090R0D9_NONUL|nr:3'-5' exonuclease [Nonlabens ulvanivorans]GAL01162.1 DNA helicase IV [Nonlabens ulvanivorans]
MKNPNQIEKTLSTPLRLKTDVKTYYSRDESNDDSLALKEAIDEIIEEIREKCDDEARSIAMLSTKSFFVLGRYNFDIDRINFENNSHFAKIDSETIKYQYSDGVTISLKFLTVHRSKGLEADFVFILNCNSGKIGFPSEIADDPVLGLILKSSDNYENSEERRLFYVALSRAKEKAVCISNSNFTSKFVLELEEGKPSSVSKKCPRCKSGDLILKQGTSANGHNWAFESCSNYAAYNCDYKEWK